jgi:competence protein ComGC
MDAQRGERGFVFVEYLLILVIFSIPTALLIRSLGMPLLQFSRYGDMVLAGPIP